MESSEKKRVKINLSLILRQHFGEEALQWHHEEQIEKLNQITHLRLDRLSIGWIDGLELIGTSLTHLYLQSNKIECIENLEFLQNLKFLMLAHNFIQEIEGLSLLPKLQLLDLSHNSIQHLNADEIPKSVIFLNLTGNMCTHLPEYSTDIRRALPRLKMLDNESVEGGHEEEDEEEEDDDEEGYEYVDSDEEEEEESSASRSASFQLSPSDLKIRRTVEDMLESSQKRTEDQFKEHKHNLKLLVEYRENTQALFEEDPSPSARTQPS